MKHNKEKNRHRSAHQKGDHQGHGDHGDHQSHHAHMVADFRRRFWISLILTLPILSLAPLNQQLLGVKEAWRFPGDGYLQFGLATAVFFYGGWPFLKGLFDELRKYCVCGIYPLSVFLLSV